MLLIAAQVYILLGPESVPSAQMLRWGVVQGLGADYIPEFLQGFATGSLNGTLWAIMVELQLYVLFLIFWKRILDWSRRAWHAGLMAAVLLNLLSCAYGWGSHRLKADLSYGIFLYHWPLINLIFFLELPTKVSHIPLFVCYLVSFLTLGVMSWYVVERRIVGARK